MLLILFLPWSPGVLAFRLARLTIQFGSKAPGAASRSPSEGLVVSRASPGLLPPASLLLAAGSRRLVPPCRRVRRDPGIGQEFPKLIARMRRQTLQHILEVGERIDLMTLAAPHEAIQSGRRPAAAITPNE